MRTLTQEKSESMYSAHSTHWERTNMLQRNNDRWVAHYLLMHTYIRTHVMPVRSLSIHALVDVCVGFGCEWNSSLTQYIAHNEWGNAILIGGIAASYRITYALHICMCCLVAGEWVNKRTEWAEWSECRSINLFTTQTAPIRCCVADCIACI